MKEIYFKLIKVNHFVLYSIIHLPIEVKKQSVDCMQIYFYAQFPYRLYYYN